MLAKLSGLGGQSRGVAVGSRDAVRNDGANWKCNQSQDRQEVAVDLGKATKVVREKEMEVEGGCGNADPMWLRLEETGNMKVLFWQELPLHGWLAGRRAR